MADLIENCKRHRGMIGLLTVLGALLLGARAQQQGLVGSDVTLVPKYTGDPKEIIWLLNGVILVEIVLKPQEETLIDHTNDRTTINKTNGALTIKYLTIGDSGDYEAQVTLMDDSSQVTKIRLTVHGCPDQPTMKVKSTEDWFVLFCKSFSPDVTYEWFNQARFVSKGRSYTEPKKNGTLTCVVGNEVCNKSSSINFYTLDQPGVKLVGDNVTLVPQYTGDPSEIIWKVNGDKLVVMVLKPKVDILFSRLQDRANISDTDGSLTIRGLTMEDSGVYTAVVLANNEYYYTEIRLPARGHEYICLSAWIIAVIVVFVVLSLFAAIFNFSRLIFLWNSFYKDTYLLSRWFLFFLLVVVVLSPFAILITIYLVWYYFYKGRYGLAFFDQTPSSMKELERCITVKFWNDVICRIDESCRLLEDHSKRIQSPRLTIQVQLVDLGNYTAETVMSNGKKCTEVLSLEKGISVGIEFEDGKTFYKPDTENMIELVLKKDGVTQFVWAVSSLKLHASNIKLEPESVTVYDAEGKESYKVKFQLEGHPESMSIRCITFHPIKMTDIDQITWKKDSQPVNIRGDRFKCEPNGDLTIYNATSEDKGKYTVQCIDDELDQEFILHL